LEEFALLGNAAAVPIIIFITQLLKKNFSFRYKADVVSFVVALVVCPLWWFWHTPELEILEVLDGNVVEVGKFGMSQLLIAVATYMTASKSYDLFSGNKKRVNKHAGEIAEMKSHIVKLENGSGSGGNHESEVESAGSDKLLDILEGR